MTIEEEVAARQAVEEKAQKLAAKLRELNIDPDALYHKIPDFSNKSGI